MQTLFVSGLCLICSSLQVKYRDVKYIVEILLMLWFYLTPIFYPLELVANMPSIFSKIYMLNPLTQLFTLYRIALINNYMEVIPLRIDVFWLVINNLVICGITFFLGFAIFKRQEHDFVDLI